MQWLGTCVRSISVSLSPHTGHVTVIDDHSPISLLDTQIQNQIAYGVDVRRVEYLRNSTTLGVAGNSHQALVTYGLNGDADFVCMPGHDDYVFPNYTDEVARLFDRHPDAVIAQPDVCLINDNDQRVPPKIADKIKRRLRPRRGELGGEAAVARLMTGNFLYTPALAYRREALKAVGQWKIPAVHDLATVVDILMQGGTIAFGEVPCFAYRRHYGSDSATRSRDVTRITEEQLYFGRIARVLDDIGWHRAARAARRHVTARAHALLSAAANARHSRFSAACSLTGRALGKVHGKD